MKLNHKIARLEVQNSSALRALAKEERKKWREANSESLRWEMFLRTRGPDSDWDYNPNQDPTEPSNAATEAFRDIFRKVLPKYNGFIEDVDFSKTNPSEKAFIVCLNHYFWSLDWFGLLSEDLDDWMDKLGLNETDPPFEDLIAAIDQHIGTPDWKEVFYHQEKQNEAMEQLRENYECRRDHRLRYKAEHPEET